MTHGLISIESSFRIDVFAVYTATGREGPSVSIDVEKIEPAESRVRVAVQRPEPPRPAAARVQMTPPPPPAAGHPQERGTQEAGREGIDSRCQAAVRPGGLTARE